MSFARAHELLRSLSVRLTLWYAGLLLVALGAAYAVSYFMVSSLALRRVDTYLREEAAECIRNYEQHGFAGIEEEVRIETAAQGTSDVYFRLLGSRDELKLESDPAPWKDLAVDVRPGKSPGSEAVFQTTTRRGAKPEVRLIALRLSPTEVLVIATSMNSDLRLVRASMRQILFVMLAVWALAAVVGLVIAHRMLQGIRAVQLAAANFRMGRTDSRVSYPHRGDEIDLLARSFNQMAERIETLLRNLRDTNDELAHELRSPLTRIRGRCELALTHGGGDNDLHGITADTIEQCDRMLGTINALLEISEIEAGVIRPATREIELQQLLASACELFEPLAEAKGVALRLTAEGPAVTTGDVGRLQRLFSNLIDNALKFTPAGGEVNICMTTANGGIRVAIADTGPGITPEEMEIIFQRFVRGKAAGEQPGNGLGLSLARTIARAHGGDILVASEPGQGAEFTVTLPLASTANMTKK